VAVILKTGFTVVVAARSGESSDGAFGGEFALIVKVEAVEVPPPGAGVKTVIGAVPALAMSAAGTVAVSWEPETYVVERALPFQFTVEFERKFAPFAVRVKPASVAVEVVGLMEVRVGAGLFPGGTVKLLQAADWVQVFEFQGSFAKAFQ
jgi:hypothetical protein